MRRFTSFFKTYVLHWVPNFGIMLAICLKLFGIQTMFGLSLLPVVCRRACVLFTFICVCLRSVVSNVLCCVFVLFVFVSCYLCCRFSGLSFFLRYSLTFIYTLITPYIGMLDSDWLIAVIFFYKFRHSIVNLQNFYFLIFNFYLNKI